MNALPELAALRQRYQRERQALLKHSPQGTSANVARLVRQLAQITNRLLQQLWQAQGLHQQPLALVATGGFGRGELYPHSDIDLLVLLPDSATEALAERAATFVRTCWDAGLEPGSSVRTLQQCQQAAAADITVQTALLERRLLAGDAALYRQLDASCNTNLQPYAFYRAKLQEMRQRHARFNHTPYALEPDCKDAPGGLRDLQTVAWVARAAGYGLSWRELQQHGLLTAYELRQIHCHHALLRRIRWHLHLQAQRREDRLLFDLQNPLAEQLGLSPLGLSGRMAATPRPSSITSKHPRKKSAAPHAMRPGELLMRRYYKAAKGISQLVQILLLDMAERLRDSGHTPRSALPNDLSELAPATRGAVLPGKGGTPGSNPVANNASAQPDYLAALRPRAMRAINPRFFDNNGLLEVASDDLYQQHPHAILETFALYQQTGLHGLSARTLRALYHARRRIGRAFRADPINKRRFMQILQAPHGVTHALRLMNQTSVLGACLPPFRRIEGQMQHDLFHIYTVDQHTLMVVRNIRRFFNAEHAHEYPLCSQLAANWPDPWILVAAALFHDIAKGRGGDHSLLGEQEVRRFARQHGIAQTDTELLAFLVREHLSLSQCAQKEDLSDPAVIARFAQLVGTERQLTGLYLLTVADIRGTSPRVWSSWKAHLLEELYRATLHALGGHLPSPEELVQARSSGALLEMARSATMPHAAHLQLWQTLDAGYFLRHDANTIAWHTQHLAAHLAQRTPAAPAAQAQPAAPDMAANTTINTTINTAVNATANTAHAKATPNTTPNTQAHARAKAESGTASQARPTITPNPPPADSPCIVKARRAPHGEGLQVLVYTRDRPALFAHICGYLARAGFSILDARIHTTSNAHALDTFQIISPRLTSTRDHDEAIAHLEANMPTALQHAMQAGSALPPVQPGRLSRRARSFPMEPHIRLDAEEKNARWRLSIHASDRPGLLYHIARTLSEHGISVQLAKISTMGERVEDTFLIEGQPLQSPQLREQLEQDLFKAISVCIAG